jgi:hypothetical protein
VEPEEGVLVTQWLFEHVSTAIKSRERSNGYRNNNRGTDGSGVFYAEESALLGAVTRQRLVKTADSEEY